jgi:single-strand DNA-binding protein
MLNSVNLQGRLVRDPDLRELANGKKITTFTLAVDRTKEATDFIRCVAFDRVAETAAAYLKKGDMAIVAGRLSVRTWKDKEDKTREETTVTVYEINFTPRARDRNTETPEKPRYQQPFEDLGDDGGELPF